MKSILQLVDAENIYAMDSAEASKKTDRQNSIRIFNAGNKLRQLGLDVANRERYLTVLGGSGMGKSTFLRKIGLEALKGNKGEFLHHCIPILLELQRFDVDDINIQELMVKEFRVCGFPNPEELISHSLRQGKFLVLLDGLDEVHANRQTHITCRIGDFADKYNKNRFVTSCQTAAYKGYLKRFTNVAIAGFDDIQIQKFIHNWFQSDLDKELGTGHECWKSLKLPENAATKGVAQSPLFLTFLCLICRKIPTS